jgi:hypothetical protein
LEPWPGDAATSVEPDAGDASDDRDEPQEDR